MYKSPIGIQQTSCRIRFTVNYIVIQTLNNEIFSLYSIQQEFAGIRTDFLGHGNGVVDSQLFLLRGRISWGFLNYGVVSTTKSVI